jgi:predicted porin
MVRGVCRTNMRRISALLSLAAMALASSEAAAEIPVVKANGWDVTIDGRLNTFISFLTGDQQPPNIPKWSGGIEEKDGGSGKLMTTRIRSAFVTNVFGFNLVKQLTPDLKVTGRFATWVGASQDKAHNDSPTLEGREVFIKLEGPWGGLLAGRNLRVFERGAILMDYDIMHGMGLGFPCSVLTAKGGACGFAGHGVLFPSFGAGFVYDTPDLSGFQATIGAFDPIAVSEKTYQRTPFPRIEAELAFKIPALHIFADALWQRIGRDDNKDQNSDSYGVAAGAQINAGPLSAGGAFYTGQGLGLFVPLEDSPLFADQLGILRKAQGFVGMASLTFGDTKVAGGAGVSQLKMTTEIDPKTGVRVESEPFPSLDIPKQQLGVTVGLYQSFYSKTLVWALEYFRGQYQWYDEQVDPSAPVNHPTQNVNFINTGLTLLW